MRSTLPTNKDLVLEYVDAFNKGDMEAVRHLFARDALLQGVYGLGSLDDTILLWKELHEAFEMQLNVEEIIAEGESVAIRCIERGMFVHQFREMAPTNKSYEIVAIEWFSAQNGQIHRRWSVRDTASQGRQLGLKEDIWLGHTHRLFG